MSDLPHFARRLRELRDDAKMTQHELAERAGVHRQTIAQFELGKRQPAWNIVMLLARALNVSTSAFDDPAIIPPPVEVKRGRGRPRLDAEVSATPAPQGRPKKARKRKGE